MNLVKVILNSLHKPQRNVTISENQTITVKSFSITLQHRQQCLTPKEPTTVQTTTFYHSQHSNRLQYIPPYSNEK